MIHPCTSEFATPLACSVEIQQRRCCSTFIGVRIDTMYVHQDSKDAILNKKLSNGANQRILHQLCTWPSVRSCLQERPYLAVGGSDSGLV